MSPIQDGIAIIGIACQLPGSKNKDELWKNLIENKESLKKFSDSEMENTEYNYQDLKNDSHFVNVRGVIEDIEKWDAKFFGVIPKDAKEMDPQHRLWLENTWHAFEDAGCNPFTYKGAIGVFAGSNMNTYLLNNILRDPEKFELYIRGRTLEMFQTYINNDPMFLATKTAYFYNLRGPAINLQTACSTSLVAVSQACSSLMSYESDVCVAGGVTIVVPQELGYMYSEDAISSPDGHCKPFDIDSKGTVFSNGVGAVVLKRMEDAVKDNDRIYAVIRGWAINNDGNVKVGYTAPGIEGQYKSISMAQSFANITADEISYIEAHGTATPLGDPIEIAALTKAFRDTTTRKQFCGIGSIKSNLGHLDAAAGIASLIKVALSAHSKIIPATLHFTAPNPRIDFKNSPFFVVDKNLAWKKPSPLIMGVSSFGIGGTNAHVIVSDYESNKNIESTTRPKIAMLSAQTEYSLNKLKENLVHHLEVHPNLNTDNITYTLQRRRNMPFRSFSMIGKDSKLSLNTFIDGENDALNELVFMFPGQGSQFISMGKNLYETEPVFKSIIDECFEVYTQLTGKNLKHLLFESSGPEAELELAQTCNTQPSLFIIEYAMARLYMHYGIIPNYCVGHSIGEYAAACISGVFDLKSALSIVVKRGELMQKIPTGNMMAVFAPSSVLTDFASELFEIAAINSDAMTTISIQPENLDKVNELFKLKELQSVALNTSHAFHSKAFEPILKEFKDFVELFTMNDYQIPFISCLTGDFITNEQAQSGDYWASQLRNTVRFSDGVALLSKYQNVVFLEVGPNTHLSGFIRQNEAVKHKSLVVKTLGKIDEFTEQFRFYKSIGELWLRGFSSKTELFYEEITPELLTLPQYPFEKKRYWIDAVNSEFVKKITKEARSIEESASDTELNSNLSRLEQIILAIKKILFDLSGIDMNAVTNETTFSSMGLDSMFLTQFAGALEKRFKVPVKFRQLSYEYASITALSEYFDIEVSSDLFEGKSTTVIKSESGIAVNNFTNLALFQPNGSQIPFVMVHGEIANEFLPDFLGKDQPYYGFFHQGNDGEQLKYKTVEDVTRHYLSELLAVQPQGPYILGGHSFGGIVAYEMSVQLQKMGQVVLMLFMIDSNNPLYTGRITLKLNSYGKLKHYILSPVNKFIHEKVKMLTSNAFILLKKPVPLSLRNFYILTHYNRAYFKYKPEKFNGQVVLFRAEENECDDHSLGWASSVNGKIEVFDFAGYHLDIIYKPENSKVFSEIVQKKLIEIQQNYLK